jgi:signal transduction histidine kinase
MGAAPTRIVRRYALTSANDFPERDPRDWRLLGSNDGGQTWTTLDVRQNETFPERHQRRLFACTNVGSFNLYRLQIDRIRSPATADALQLSEIEPLNNPGEENPRPIFCDALAAQGDNEPSETAAAAFDGQADSKWLDFAAIHSTTRASWIQWRYLDHTGLILTNLQQLHALRSRAADGFAVRIAGTTVGVVTGTQKICVFDGTSWIDVAVPDAVREGLPGRKLLLTGHSGFVGGAPMIDQPRAAWSERPAMAEPARIAPEELLTNENEFPWVEAAGQVRFSTDVGGEISFDIDENAHRSTVHVLHSGAGQHVPPEGARVRVRGLAGGILNEDGALVAGALWAIDLDAIKMADPEALPAKCAALNTTNGPAEGEPYLKRIDQIRHLSWAELAREPRVKVRGVITDTAGGCIQDASGGVEMALHNEVVPHPPGTGPMAQGLGAYVEVEGRGVLLPGHGPSGKGVVIAADTVRLLGRGKLPTPVRPSWSMLASGQMDAQWVEVDAIVRATDGSHLMLACENGQFMATVRAAPITAIKALVDAKIRLQGVSLAANDARGQTQGGVELLVPSLEFIQVLQFPADTAGIPTLPIADLRQLRATSESSHRVKINGVLTCSDENGYCVQDATGGAFAIPKEDVVLSLAAGGWWTFWQAPRPETSTATGPALHVGDRVEVVGFPEFRDFAPTLTEASCTRLGAAESVTPTVSSAEVLGRGEYDSKLVTLEGLVQGVESLGRVMIFQIQSGLRTFRATLPAAAGVGLNVAPGSRVRVTGVCQMEPASHAELGKRPVDFSIRLREASDVSVLALPPWLSLRRSLVIVSALILILAAAFAWIRLLHRQVALRTRQLEEQVREHEKTEALLAGKTWLLQEEIEERKRVQAEAEKIHKQLLTTSRLAGMADVATNVLHNVGNVLNSVNILTDSITFQIRNLRFATIAKVGALLSENEKNIGSYLGQDPTGRQLPEHLLRLGAHLSEEQVRLIDKTDSLSESIQHIKEIVAMQQNYAKVSGVLETVALGDVVEDALRLCTGSLAQHNVEIRRDFDEVPCLTIDRHKILQILFNLLDNAKHACLESEQAEKHISVRLRRRGEHFVQIEVVDNGAGIAPENLKKIFTQGFSTRHSGHGFGLHSSILTAEEMGGSLTAANNVPPPGASFILEIPLTLPGERHTRFTAARPRLESVAS